MEARSDLLSLNNVDRGDEFLSSEDTLNNLYPALVECFGIIILGYIAGRFNFVSEVQAKGLSIFVGTFSLPALIFGNLCSLDLNHLNLKFLLAITLAKATTFFAVMIITFIVVRNSYGKAALFAMCVTQSNDFALGYPILESIYAHTRPDVPMYLYLVAPVNLAVLNPIGFALMEMEKERRNGETPGKKTVLKILKNLITNPIIFMSLLGLLFGATVFRGNPVPAVMHNFLDTLGKSFPAAALFLLGIQMVGKMKNIEWDFLMVPLILVFVKSLVLPIIAREITTVLDVGGNVTETGLMSNFAFLYGTFPTAPPVFVFATQFKIVPDMISAVVVMSTVVSAPIMFISARLLTINSLSPGDYLEQLEVFMMNVCGITLVALLWTVFVFISYRKIRCIPHSQTFAIMICQISSIAGAITWSVLSCTHGWKLYLQFVLFSFGIYGSRINTALLSLLMLLQEIYNHHVVKKCQKLFLVIGMIFPALLVVVLASAVAGEAPAHGKKTDPIFQFGSTQAAVGLCVLLVSFVTVITCLLMMLWLKERRVAAETGVSSPGSTRRLLAGGPEEETPVVGVTRDVEDLAIGDTATEACDSPERGQGNSPRNGGPRYRYDSEHREYYTSLIERYNAPPALEAVEEVEDLELFHSRDSQTDRHVALLIFQILSMFVGISLCTWMLVMEKFNGIYLFLLFLDAFGSLGQGVIPFVAFGLNPKYVFVPVMQYLRKLWYGQDKLILPSWEDLDEDTKQVCHHFLKRHIGPCMEEIVKDVRVRLILRKAVFKGTALVDWLIEMGIVSDRQAGETYGEHLLRGRVIRHIDNHVGFYDDKFIYTFEPERENQ